MSSVWTYRKMTMRPTLIVYAHPETLRILSEVNHRFSGRRQSFRDRFYAAWLVFTGRADALMWDGEHSFGLGQ